MRTNQELGFKNVRVFGKDSRIEVEYPLEYTLILYLGERRGIYRAYSYLQHSNMEKRIDEVRAIGDDPREALRKWHNAAVKAGLSPGFAYRAAMEYMDLLDFPPVTGDTQAEEKADTQAEEKKDEAIAQSNMIDAYRVARWKSIERSTYYTQGEVLARIAEEDCDLETRCAAIERLDPATHGEVLARIAESDYDLKTRCAAIKRLDPAKHGNILARIAETKGYWETQIETASQHIQNFRGDKLARIVESDADRLVRMPETFIRCTAIERLNPVTHGHILARIAETDVYWQVRVAATKRLDPATHGEILVRIAETDDKMLMKYPATLIRIAAIERLNPATHGDTLARIAETSDDPARCEAIKRLDPAKHGDILTRIAKAGSDFETRMAALEQLEKITKKIK